MQAWVTNVIEHFRRNVCCLNPKKSSFESSFAFTPPCGWPTAFSLSKLQRRHHVCAVDILFDGTVLWIRTVTPVLGYLLEELQTYKPQEEGNLPIMHAIPRGTCAPLPLRSYRSRVGVSGFPAQLPSSQDQGESEPSYPAISTLVPTLA